MAKGGVKQCTHIPRAPAHSTHAPGYARHQVIATSRTDYNREAQGMGVTYFMDADDFVEEVCEHLSCSACTCLS
jgi:hypothetical protein